MTENTEEPKKRKTAVVTHTVPKKAPTPSTDNKFKSAGDPPLPPPMPEPEPELPVEPERPKYQDTIPEFPGLRVREENSFKAQHRQRGVYIEHELDAILRQQQAMIGKGTVTKIVNAALREYFKKHRIAFIDDTQRTDGTAQHNQK